LTGAYQDIMGDMHNLFGRVARGARLRRRRRPGGLLPGGSDPGRHHGAGAGAGCSTSRANLAKRIKQALDAKVREGQVKPKERRAAHRLLRAGDARLHVLDHGVAFRVGGRSASSLRKRLERAIPQLRGDRAAIAAMARESAERDGELFQLVERPSRAARRRCPGPRFPRLEVGFAGPAAAIHRARRRRRSAWGADDGATRREAPPAGRRASARGTFPWPAVRQQGGRAVSGASEHRGGKKMLGEWQDVVRTGAQRRELHGHAPAAGRRGPRGKAPPAHPARGDRGGWRRRPRTSMRRGLARAHRPSPRRLPERGAA